MITVFSSFFQTTPFTSFILILLHKMILIAILNQLISTDFSQINTTCLGGNLSNIKRLSVIFEQNKLYTGKKKEIKKVF